MEGGIGGRMGEEWRHRKHSKKRKVALARLWSPQLHLDCCCFRAHEMSDFQVFPLKVLDVCADVMIKVLLSPCQGRKAVSGIGTYSSG